MFLDFWHRDRAAQREGLNFSDLVVPFWFLVLVEMHETGSGLALVSH